MSRSETGFTLIELLITIAAVGILSISTATLIIYLVQLFLYAPIELKVDQVAEEVLNTIIEGDQDKRGLRFATDITTAQDNRIVFTNAEGKSIDINWDSLEKRLTRQVDGGTIEAIPEYIGDIEVSGVDNIIFKYYDSLENLLSTPVGSQSLGSIKRVKLEIIVNRPSASPLAPYLKVTSSVATPLNN